MKAPLFKELTTIGGNVITVSKNSLTAPPSETKTPMTTQISYEILQSIKSNVLVFGDPDAIREWWLS